MSVQDYPITTQFGQVPGYPLNNGFHNGIDYGCPSGTPIIVNGVTIALSNNTGDTTGPHLHVGKYMGDEVQNPGVGNGFQFESAIVYDTGYDAVNGNYVRITGNGALWNYLHLQTILVTKGQVLKGDNMPGIIPTSAQIDETISRFYYVAYGIPATSADFADLRPLLNNNYVEGVMTLLLNAVSVPESLLGKSKNTVSGATKLNPGLYQV